ncbi:hypothetical protein BD626DRAFT_229915 [Schizophyllum amplum]|uniref:Uncharacterized protein n=1 Tax=Schizophyllum amplum TaxID=97359 RepID=A0A550BWE5_9AGAR|nr:hypothetical protein BD626DRAFT_229915 [Auriculariopsis ampla]
MRGQTPSKRLPAVPEHGDCATRERSLPGSMCPRPIHAAQDEDACAKMYSGVGRRNASALPYAPERSTDAQHDARVAARDSNRVKL